MTTLSPSTLDGVLVVDKPTGPTSHDVVARVRRLSGQRRIGHTGTLDPLASGVLPLLLGQATRLMQFFVRHDKTYEATVRLGVETDTFDITGRTVAGTAPQRPVTRPEVEGLLPAFVGRYEQWPPPFSAKKVAGKPAYALARTGTPVQPMPVSVSVSRLDLVDFDGTVLALDLACSTGFYVRSLAHDLGARLGTGACLQTLRRLQSGPFSLRDAVPLDRLERHPETLVQSLTPMSALLLDLPAIHVTEEGARRAGHGNVLRAEHVTADAVFEGPLRMPTGPVRVLARDGRLLAIADPVEPSPGDEGGPQGVTGVFHPRIVVSVGMK